MNENGTESLLLSHITLSFSYVKLFMLPPPIQLEPFLYVKLYLCFLQKVLEIGGLWRDVYRAGLCVCVCVLYVSSLLNTAKPVRPDKETQLASSLYPSMQKENTDQGLNNSSHCGKYIGLSFLLGASSSRWVNLTDRHGFQYSHIHAHTNMLYDNKEETRSNNHVQ